MRKRGLRHADQDRIEAAPGSIVEIANRVVVGEFRDERPCAVSLNQERLSLGIGEVSPVLDTASGNNVDDGVPSLAELPLGRGLSRCGP